MNTKNKKLLRLGLLLVALITIALMTSGCTLIDAIGVILTEPCYECGSFGQPVNVLGIEFVLPSIACWPCNYWFPLP